MNEKVLELKKWLQEQAEMSRGAGVYGSIENSFCVPSALVHYAAMAKAALREIERWENEGS